MRSPGPVLVLGAGSVGCFVGGQLLGAGAGVHFIGRGATLAALRSHGLTLSDCDGGRRRFEPATLSLHGSATAGVEAARARAPGRAVLVLLCVKCGATAAAAQELPALPAGSVLLSLQNGLHNAELAAAAMAPGTAATVLPGMVGFNVAALAPGHWHRGTSGDLAAQDHAAMRPWAGLFAAAGLPLQLHADLRPVQWGKLLLNLNNPVNALSGLPLKQQLLDAGHRRVLAALQRELLGLLTRAGLRAARVGPAPPGLLPWILALPTPLFRLLAARMLRIDDRARSSMADDVAAGRPTEIDALAGEVVRLAQSLGADAPLNRRLVQLMQQRPVPRLDAAALRAALQAEG